jgi:hypothetical protein
MGDVATALSGGREEAEPEKSKEDHGEWGKPEASGLPGHGEADLQRRCRRGKFKTS